MTPTARSIKGTGTSSSEPKPGPKGALPAQLERVELLKRALVLLEEAQRRASDLRDEASSEITDVVKNLRRNYRGLVAGIDGVEDGALQRAKQNADQILKKLLDKSTVDNLHALPEKLAGEVDGWLERLGLMRKEKHVAALRKAARGHSDDDTQTRASTTQTKPTKKRSPRTAAKKKPAGHDQSIGR